MEKDNSTSDKTKKNGKKRIVRFVSLGVIVMVILLAFFLPIMMGDGTESLSDVEQNVAQQVKRDAQMNVHGIDRIGTPYITVHIDAVYATPVNEAKGWCGYPTGSDTQGHYSVMVSYRTIFGFSIREYTAENCAPTL